MSNDFFRGHFVSMPATQKTIDEIRSMAEFAKERADYHLNAAIESVKGKTIQVTTGNWFFKKTTKEVPLVVEAKSDVLRKQMITISESYSYDDPINGIEEWLWFGQKYEKEKNCFSHFINEASIAIHSLAGKDLFDYRNFNAARKEIKGIALPEPSNETFLILNGDQVTAINFMRKKMAKGAP